MLKPELFIVESLNFRDLAVAGIVMSSNLRGTNTRSKLRRAEIFKLGVKQKLPERRRRSLKF